MKNTTSNHSISSSEEDSLDTDGLVLTRQASYIETNTSNSQIITSTKIINLDQIDAYYQAGLDKYKKFSLVFAPKEGRADSSRDEAVKILKEIRRLDLPFPLTRYVTDRKLVVDAFNLLKNYSPEWIERSHDELKCHDGDWWLPSLFRGKGCQLVCKKNDWFRLDVVIDYFTEDERIRAKKEYSCSMADSWKDDEAVIKAILNCGTKKVVNCKNLRDSIFYVGRELALFRVTRAKALVQMILFGDTKGTSNISAPLYPQSHEKAYDNTGKRLVIPQNRCKGLRWLDMSAGWGDRLFAACALEMDYLGFDPNQGLERGQSEMIHMFGSNYDGRQHQEVIYRPFEQCSDLVEANAKQYGLFDISLLSPPFYIIERYNGQGQSTDSYPGFDDWMVKFLFKSLAIIWKNLKDGGFLAINIANIRNCDIVGPMQLFIEDCLTGCFWEGIITFAGRSTQDVPGSIYVWRKTIAAPGTIGARQIWNPEVTRSLKSCFPNLYQSWLKFTSS